ncbi:hypothetical protein EVAR_96267_1 [Eumeta japonica]|uniref:ZP domain-containing protein n=1 Tax=Eumeta variegata TaxID=151549 RepID=A0A4C1WJV0_EUMVA|nr:hypothetical protein EVAR_96267_1 [Eumeta japonica]
MDVCRVSASRSRWCGKDHMDVHLTFSHPFEGIVSSKATAVFRDGSSSTSARSKNCRQDRDWDRDRERERERLPIKKIATESLTGIEIEGGIDIDVVTDGTTGVKRLNIIVLSSSQHGDPRCVYVPPSTGQKYFSFRIAYAKCGTKPASVDVSANLKNRPCASAAHGSRPGGFLCADGAGDARAPVPLRAPHPAPHALHLFHFCCRPRPAVSSWTHLNGQFYENTVVVQYDKDLLEVWDEAKRLRCEWFNDYEKTASKPPMVIADLDVVQLDFRGDNVDCWMEIQAGKGPWAAPVSGIVPLGSTLTLVVAINDYRGEFDMRVKSCAASDGSGHVIHLSDEYGCVLRPKMISRFLKAKAVDERATVITYAFFHAFKFPDALSVHIRCKVEICRHGCLDHCQLGGALGHAALDRKDDRTHRDNNDISDENEESSEVNSQPLEELFGDAVSGDAVAPPAPLQRKPAPVVETGTDHQAAVEELVEALARPFTDRPIDHGDRERFPHGPRNFGSEVKPEKSDTIVPAHTAGPVAGPRSLRKRRTVRDARSADVGVSGIYEVVSEADLAFGPSRESVTVFSGRIREEVVYGVCMGAVSFGALFASAAGAAAGAALAAAVMLQRLRARSQVHPPPAPPPPASHSLAAWMALRLLGTPHAHHSREG